MSRAVANGKGLETNCNVSCARLRKLRVTLIEVATLAALKVSPYA